MSKVKKGAGASIAARAALGAAPYYQRSKKVGEVRASKQESTPGEVVLTKGNKRAREQASRRAIKQESKQARAQECAQASQRAMSQHVSTTIATPGCNKGLTLETVFNGDVTHQLTKQPTNKLIK